MIVAVLRGACAFAVFGVLIKVVLSLAAVGPLWLAASAFVVLFANLAWILDCFLAAFAFRWLALPFSLQHACDGTVVLWHVSKNRVESFAHGIDFDRVQEDFLGKGFYVWGSAAGAEGYILPSARTVLRIEVDAEHWHKLTRDVVRSKFELRYFLLTHLWMWRDVRWVSLRRRRMVSRLLRTGDAVHAPAIGIPSRDHQVLLRSTDATKELLARARIVAFGIRPGRLRATIQGGGELHGH